jgi:phosphoglucosamine mutase
MSDTAEAKQGSRTKLFGTSGIRGLITTTMTPQLALQTGQALATYTKAKTILTAYDTRETSPMLQAAFAAGVTACGAVVLDQGIVPTPVLAYLTKWTHVQAGIMTTASHNPPDYNGIKPYNPDTTAYSQVQQSRLERLICSGEFRFANWRETGKIIQIDETQRYLEMIRSSVRLDKPWKVVVDPGNGATSHLAPRILRELGCRVTTMNSQPDGHFPGRGAEPNEKTLRPLGSVVRRLKADIGLAYDGDGDRMVPVDETGHVTPPDQTFASYAAHRVRQRKNKTVVTHVEASLCVEEMVEKAGGRIVRTKVGDVNITQGMRKQKATFGGEPCGAWIHPNYHYCPDGILSSILFLQALEESGEKPSAFVSEAPTYPVLRTNITCPSQALPQVMRKAAKVILEGFPETKEQSTLDGVRLTFSEAWLLIRPSGTEPLVRVTVEAKTRQGAETLMKSAVKFTNHLVREACR